MLAHERVLASDGREMHKSWGNAIWLDDALEKMGPDVIRHMFASQAITEPMRFGFEGARDVKRRFLTFWNVYSLFVTYANLDRPALLGPDSVPTHSAPLDQWGATRSAFPEGIYHGAALSAVADQGGGLHLVYKDDGSTLWYRHFDGATFGPRLLIQDQGDWALQPAVTLVGSELLGLREAAVSEMLVRQRKHLRVLRRQSRAGSGHARRLRREALASRAGTAFLAPRAIRAFTPVFDRLWRGRHGRTGNRYSAR